MPHDARCAVRNELAVRKLLKPWLLSTTGKVPSATAASRAAAYDTVAGMSAVRIALIAGAVKSRTSYVSVPSLPATAGYQISTAMPFASAVVVTPTGYGPGSTYALANSSRLTVVVVSSAVVVVCAAVVVGSSVV